MRYIFMLLRGLAFVILGIIVIILGGRTVVWLTSTDVQAGLSAPPEVYSWTSSIPNFSGYSSLIISQDGRSILTASDRGHFISGTIMRDVSGRIEAIEAVQKTPLRLHTGAQTDQFQSDLEGLAPLPDGTIALAFESYTRLQIMAPITSTEMDLPQTTHRWDLFEPLFHNFAFEAITALPNAPHANRPYDATILAIMEYSDVDDATDAYMYDGATWHGPVSFPRSPGFHVSGADVGPDNCLYVLERHYGVFTGFQFRLSRRSATNWDAPATLLFQSAAMGLGNGEGVSIWRRGDQMIASIITDNGIPSFEATRLIELPLSPAPGCGDR